MILIGILLSLIILITMAIMTKSLFYEVKRKRKELIESYKHLGDIEKNIDDIINTKGKTLFKEGQNIKEKDDKNE